MVSLKFLKLGFNDEIEDGGDLAAINQRRRENELEEIERRKILDIERQKLGNSQGFGSTSQGTQGRFGMGNSQYGSNSFNGNSSPTNKRLPYSNSSKQ